MPKTKQMAFYFTDLTCAIARECDVRILTGFVLNLYVPYWIMDVCALSLIEL